MFKQYIDKSKKRLSSLSPQAVIAGALIIVVLVSGVALLLTRGSSEAKASALQPYAARLDRVDGAVGIARAVEGDQELDWTEATVNTPVTVGHRIYTRDYAHASIALSGQNYVRLNPSTSLDVLALEDRRTQFALRSGSALFEVGALPADLYEVATPCGAVDFREPGLYQIGMDGGNAVISVLNGLAQVVGQEGSGYISKGQVYTLTPAATEALASSLSYDTAGEIVDDYYRYRYPKVYDGRYRRYDAYLEEPSYYDPYRTSVSYQYLPADIPGLYDLDYYGDWVNVNDYGYCWAPRVNAGWAPYRSGYWDLDGLWGPSWISHEPWGWAPYHYGRWTFVEQRWFWVPVEVRTRPVYYPAPVAFIPFADQIGWVPLAPGEVYVARYYDDFQPTYLASPDLVSVVTAQTTFVNYSVPNAVTVVPIRSFNQVIDPQLLAPVDVAVVRNSRPVIDPFSLAEVRQLATRREKGSIKFAGHEREALNTAVVTSSTPDALPARGDLAKRFRAEAVSERKKDGKLNIKETAQVTSLRRTDGLPQPLAQTQRMNELASRAEQGDKSARREMRQLMREQQGGGGKPSAGQPPQQAQQEQLWQKMKQQRKAERQPQTAGARSQEAVQQRQLMKQMKQQRAAERQQQAQPAARQAQQPKAQRQESAGAAAQQRQMRRQQQQQQLRQQQPQPRKAQPQPARRKPPELTPPQQRSQRAQQSTRQWQLSRQQQPKARFDQRQAVMQQQQAARRQAALQQQATQRQAAMQQRAARAQSAQRQVVVQQQAARAQAAQRHVVKQQHQAVRAQAPQRQAASPSMQRAPSYVGPPAQQGASRKPDKARKPK